MLSQHAAQSPGGLPVEGPGAEPALFMARHLPLFRLVAAHEILLGDGRTNLSIFAPPSLRFSLAGSTLPLLTTKRTFCAES